MKITIIISFFILILAGCSQKSVIPIQANQNDKGNILLKIDRENKPANVIEVDAYLTREGYDTLSASLNLVTDTTADVTMNDIAAGDWHLTVNALDENSVVVYSGETDVTILAEITTQVYLTLDPTGNGFGNIYIHVGWGTPQNTGWTDYQYNPIFSPSQNPSYPNGLIHPKVLYENGIYKMWYTSVYNSAVTNVWYMESADGLNWTDQSNSPVLSPGDSYSWDSHAVQSGAIIKESNEYKMYYLGFSDEYGYWNIGLATSPDGINWTKYPNPVIYADPNEYQIYANDIIKIDQTYYLYYSVRNSPVYYIKLATSTDGISWTKYSNPILVADKTWEADGVFNPSVINDNGQYKMVYMNSLGNGFGLAV